MRIVSEINIDYILTQSAIFNNETRHSLTVFAQELIYTLALT